MGRHPALVRRVYGTSEDTEGKGIRPSSRSPNAGELELMPGTSDHFKFDADLMAMSSVSRRRDLRYYVPHQMPPTTSLETEYRPSDGVLL